MKRFSRPLITAVGIMAIVFAVPLASILPSTAAEPEGEFDSYGGKRAIVGEITGFFHLKEVGNRHFLITPDGHGYRALGINHFHMMTSRDYDGVIRQIKGWGFNAGCYQGSRWMWKRFPYTKGINLVPTSPYKSDEHFGFRDVFAAGFLVELEESIRKIVEPQSENAFLIGYFWTDIGVWERERKGESWISFFQSLPADSEGGKVWRKWKSTHPEGANNEFLPLIAK